MVYYKEMNAFSKLDWEEIERRGHDFIRRAPIPGGWLVQSGGMKADIGGIAFVPDAQHQWELPTLEREKAEREKEKEEEEERHREEMERQSILRDWVSGVEENIEDEDWE